MEFDDFYRQHRDGLIRLCYLATLDVEAAADACQEAMMRAFSRWDTLAQQAPLAWVRQVGPNLCWSRWRTQASRGPPLPRRNR
jgi:DNA-directed RNA polymerase specialized sigma24 family protein